MKIGVVKYLSEDGKGFIHDPELEKNIVELIHNYLELRNNGSVEPGNSVTIDLKMKITIERDLILNTKN